MPITLNHSNISVQYSTGSNYIIETVKSDLYLRDSRVGISSNLLAEPTVSPTITSNLAIFTHSGGTENQTPHTIYFPENTVCDILVVGGGGGGGSGHGGGGGAGALIYKTNYTLTAGSYRISIGSGGNGGRAEPNQSNGSNGQDTTIVFNSTNTIFRAKGGGGGLYAGGGGSGGSGGGGGADGGGFGGVLTNNIPQDSDVFGFAGGSAAWQNYIHTGGGGGANGVGGNGSGSVSGNGGAGKSISITGTSVFYAGGGGGSVSGLGTAGSGGVGGGGNGSVNGVDAFSAQPNTGGGGGGSGYGSRIGQAGKGGSGIVIIKVISPITNKYLFFNYLADQPTLNYTINFPTRTIINFVNNNLISYDKVMNGQYTVSVRTTQSTITPTQGQNLEDRLYFTSNLVIRYHTLNPIKTAEGAQWTYNSSNTNVYHMGSVGIGTTSPEYQLDVRGNIFTSTGGYTQTGLTTWTVMSDRRIKENIVKASYEKCLENVKNIELYNFNFKDNCVNTNDKNQLGFIAQEVQQVYPKAVEVGNMMLNTNETIDNVLTLNTTQIKYTLYGAVKELINKVEKLETKINK